MVQQHGPHGGRGYRDLPAGEVQGHLPVTQREEGHPALVFWFINDFDVYLRVCREVQVDRTGSVSTDCILYTGTGISARTLN